MYRLFNIRINLIEQSAGNVYNLKVKSCGNNGVLFILRPDYRVANLHSDMAASLNNLAALYHEAGRYDEAGPLFLRARKPCNGRMGRRRSASPSICSTWPNTIAERVSRRTRRRPEHQASWLRPQIARRTIRARQIGRAGFVRRTSLRGLPGHFPHEGYKINLCAS